MKIDAAFRLARANRPTDMNNIECPKCHGDGKLLFVFQPGSLKCRLCDGSGKISEEQARWVKAGRAHRNLRVGRNQSLKVRAQQLGIRMMELSEMENGYKDPSSLL